MLVGISAEARTGEAVPRSPIAALPRGKEADIFLVLGRGCSTSLVPFLSPTRKCTHKP